MFFSKEDPKTVIEGIDKAQKLLDERYEKKLIPYEVYIKQCKEFNDRRAKYVKKLGKDI